MAMLQLGGPLINATVRITPRVSWWISAQHLLSASSVATNPDPAAASHDPAATSPDPAAESPKDEKIEKIENIDDKLRNQNDKDKKIKNQSLITAAFKSLTSKPDLTDIPLERRKKLNKKIISATTVDEVLEISKDAAFTIEHASTVIYVLCKWMSTGRIKMKEIEADPRYIKVCKILNRQVNAPQRYKPEFNENWVSDANLRNRGKFSDNFKGILQPDNTSKIVQGLDTAGMIKALSALANQQKRSASFLRNIAVKIVSSNEKLNIKQLTDILYSMSVLNFYDEELMAKICTDLITLIPKNTGSAVVGSILTSMGLLRYRNEEVLDLLSTWMVEHQDVVRPQEINSLLMTLALVGYIPINFSELYKYAIEPLKESDMCYSSEWLDNIWALTVLNQADSKHYESVLNNGFINRLVEHGADLLPIPKALKLLNVNAAARLCPNYKEPLLPKDSKFFNTVIMKTKEKAELSNSITSALRMLLPSEAEYLNVNVNTNMGFLLDAEFCVDNKCTPLPVNSTTKQNKINRIAILSCAYHEYCRGTNEVKGPIKLFRKLLEGQGYKVMVVPYTAISVRDKLVTRAKLINDNIKVLLEEQTKQ